MPSNTTTFAPILTPEQVGALVMTPLSQLSIAGQTMTIVQTSSHTYRIPIVTADPSAVRRRSGGNTCLPMQP